MIKKLFLSWASSDHGRFLSLLDEEEDIPSLFPFQTLDYVGFFCAVTGLILAAGAGIGGGGILVGTK